MTTTNDSTSASISAETTQPSMPAVTVTQQAAPPANAPRRPRQARLYVSRIDPWSIMKSAFMLSLALAIVIVVAVAMLWWVLDFTGTFEAASRNVNDIVGNASTGFDLMNVISFGRVMGVAIVVASVEVVLVSAIATAFAYIYNSTVGITGGIEVVLGDDV